MFFKQIYEPGLAHASYMVGCQQTGECLVIDAKRDVDTYLDVARKERLNITHLAETHIHADFLAGTRELHELTKAPMYLSDEGGADWQYEFDHVGLRDGDVFMVGNLKIQVLHTPGHTPEHISFLVTDTPASPEVPVMIFTGDFVFVGDVGRPDLLEKAAGYKNTMDAGARQLWKSLERFRALPDHVQVHPAHGAGSACGKALGSVPSSTVGYEKLVNWAFKHTNEDDFVQDLLHGQPEPPFYFAKMKHLNKVPRPLLTSVPSISEVTVADIAEALQSNKLVVDTRNKADYAAGHIPGTISIPNNKTFSTWAGWILSYDEPFLLIAHPSTTDDLMRKLMRIGLDSVAGYLPDIQAWTQAGRKLEIVEQISLDQLHQSLGNPDVTIIDVRNAVDFEQAHIPGSKNIHTGYILTQLDAIPHHGTVVLSCTAGDRSSIAASLLLHKGFHNVKNFPLGFNGWKGAQAPVEVGDTLVA